MTKSEFETLRDELRAFRMEVENRFSGLESRFSGLEARFVRLEAKVDEKPGAIVIYQATFGVFTGICAVIVGTLIVMKTLGFLP